MLLNLCAIIWTALLWPAYLTNYLILSLTKCCYCRPDLVTGIIKCLEDSDASVRKVGKLYILYVKGLWIFYLFIFKMNSSFLHKLLDCIVYTCTFWLYFYVLQCASYTLGNMAYSSAEVYPQMAPAIPLLTALLDDPVAKTRANSAGQSN